MKKLMALAALLAPATALADPLDTGEAYTTRKGPPDWMSGVDFTWLLVDYGLFALLIAALGWVLARRQQWFVSFEHVIRWPFARLFAASEHLPIILRELAQGIIGLAVLGLIVAWVLFCQWLKHEGLGGVSMAGLALVAVIVVRAIRQDEKAPLINQP